MNYIKCRNLVKKYPGSDRKALDSINFEIPTKGIFALIGRNGAGKTTLVRILATQLALTSGSVEINRFDVMKNANDIRKFIAVVPQEARTINWLSPMQQIQSYLLWRGFSYTESHKRAVNVLRNFGISKYANLRNSSLSGGTKRKVLAATVIASDAKILFLDEPTTGLDPIAREELWNLLFKLKSTHFIFLTTHYLEEAERLADSIAIMHEGRMLTIGSMDQLRSRMKYTHSIRFRGSIGLAGYKCDRTIGKDGYTQLLMSEKDAYEISKKLLSKGISFSINPTSLDNIFYYYAKSALNEGDNDE